MILTCYIDKQRLEAQIHKTALSGQTTLIDNAEALPLSLLDRILEITTLHVPPIMASRQLLRTNFTHGTPGVVFRLKELNSRQSTLFASEYIKSPGEKSGTEEWECSTEFIARTARNEILCNHTGRRNVLFKKHCHHYQKHKPPCP